MSTNFKLELSSLELFYTILLTHPFRFSGHKTCFMQQYSESFGGYGLGGVKLIAEKWSKF